MAHLVVGLATLWPQIREELTAFIGFLRPLAAVKGE